MVVDLLQRGGGRSAAGMLCDLLEFCEGLGERDLKDAERILDRIVHVEQWRAAYWNYLEGRS